MKIDLILKGVSGKSGFFLIELPIELPIVLPIVTIQFNCETLGRLCWVSGPKKR